MKRLLLMADHPLIVQAIRLALRQTAGFQVVGYVDGRRCASSVLSELRPDVIVLDDMKDREDALARLREAAERVPSAECLLLSARMDQEWVDEAFAAGAGAVISKTVHPVALGTLLREIVAGNVVHRPRRIAASTPPCPLTARELEILQLAAQGRTNGQIARGALGHRADREVPSPPTRIESSALPTGRRRVGTHISTTSWRPMTASRPEQAEAPDAARLQTDTDEAQLGPALAAPRRLAAPEPDGSARDGKIDEVPGAVDGRTLEIIASRRRRGRPRRRGWLVRRLLLLADLAGLVAAFALAETVLTDSNQQSEWIGLVVALPAWILMAKVYGLYDRDEERADHSTVDDLVGVFHLVTVGAWLLFLGGGSPAWPPRPSRSSPGSGSSRSS